MAGRRPRRRRREPPALRARPAGCRAVARHPRRRGRRPATTSSTSAAAASPPPSWSAAARAVPEVTVADVYEHPTARRPRRRARRDGRPRSAQNRTVRPVPLKTQVGQIVSTIPLRTLTGLRWLTWLGVGNHAAAGVLAWPGCPRVSWWWVAAAGCSWSPRPAGCSLGRGRRPAAAARRRPGRLPARRQGPPAAVAGRAARRRAGCGEPVRRAVDAASTRGARRQGRQGRRPARDPAGHRHAQLGDGCSIEPEVDLRGHWIDGDVRARRTRSTSATGARVGARSMLLPGADIGGGAEVAPGLGGVRRRAGGRVWSGAPAERVGTARGPWRQRPAARPAALAGGVRRACAVADLAPAAARVLAGRRSPWRPGAVRERAARRGRSAAACLAPAAAMVGTWSLALLVWALVRLLASGLPRGTIRSTAGRRGRPGRSCGCWTRPGRGCSRCTPAR